MFMVSAQVTRSDVFGPQESVWRSLRCGPFLAAEDQDPEYPPAEYFCDLDVTFEHPKGWTPWKSESASVDRRGTPSSRETP